MLPPESPQGGIDQFLQPQSMVTPGALGAIAMMGTNAIAGNFAHMSLPLTALLLSSLFGLAALVKSTSIPERVLYYVLNTIIIFSVASGSNKIGQQVSQKLTMLWPFDSAYATSRFDIHARALENVQFFKEWYGDSSNDGSIAVPPSRTAWQKMFMLDVHTGTYNVIVSSLGDSLQRAQQRKLDLCAHFPRVAFRLWPTIAPAGGNQQYAIVIGYGLSQKAALFVAAEARKLGIAEDAFVTLQAWDGDNAAGELCS